MQQYILSDDGPTGQAAESTPARSGTGLTTKIVVAGALDMLTLVIAMLATSFYTVSNHFENAYLEQADTIFRTFVRSKPIKDDLYNTAQLVEPHLDG